MKKAKTSFRRAFLVLLAVVLVAIPLLGIACEEEEELEALFSADHLTGTAPLDVTFTDESKGDPTVWEWDFGDGETSAEQSPTHTYLMEGMFTVSLTVTDADGNTDTEIIEGCINTTGVTYETLSLRMQTPYAETDLTGLAATKFKDLLEGYTGGSVTVDIFFDGYPYEHQDQFEAIKEGDIDVCVEHPGYCRQYDLNFDFSGSVVGLILTKEHGRLVNNDPEWREHVSALFESYNIKFLDYIETYLMSGYLAQVELESYYDLEGMKLYQGRPGEPEPHESIYDIERVWVPDDQVPGAIMGGTIEVFAIPANMGWERGLWQLFSHVLLRMFYNCNSIIMNLEVWNDMSPELQDLITDYVMPGVTEYTAEIAVEQHKEAVKGFVDNLDSVHMISAAEEDQLWADLSAYEPFQARLAAMDQDILAEIMALRPEVTEFDQDVIDILTYGGVPIPE